MVITLYTEDIVLDIRSISHHEVAEIPDVEARYRAEAGSDKLPLIYKGITRGVADIKASCARFLRPEYAKEGDNTRDIPETYVFDFSGAERRAIGKAAPLANAMSRYIAHRALSSFYSDVSQGELSSRHEDLATRAGEDIINLIYSKVPPRV